MQLSSFTFATAPTATVTITCSDKHQLAIFISYIQNREALYTYAGPELTITTVGPDAAHALNHILEKLEEIASH